MKDITEAAETEEEWTGRVFLFAAVVGAATSARREARAEKSNRSLSV